MKQNRWGIDYCTTSRSVNKCSCSLNPYRDLINLERVAASTVNASQIMVLYYSLPLESCSAACSPSSQPQRLALSSDGGYSCVSVLEFEAWHCWRIIAPRNFCRWIQCFKKNDSLWATQHSSEPTVWLIDASMRNSKDSIRRVAPWGKKGFLFPAARCLDSYSNLNERCSPWQCLKLRERNNCALSLWTCMSFCRCTGLTFPSYLSLSYKPYFLR